jgi:uncharacterized protein (TIGR03067 family)
MTALLLTIPLLVAAPVPKDFKKPVPKLDGAWRLNGLELNGRQLGGNQNAVWRFDGDQLTIENPNALGATAPRPITTDAKASPKHFQFGNAGNQLGVYEIKGDALVICLSQQQGVRPPDAAGGQNVIRYLFTRVAGK